MAEIAEGNWNNGDLSVTKEAKPIGFFPGITKFADITVDFVNRHFAFFRVSRQESRVPK